MNDRKSNKSNVTTDKTGESKKDSCRRLALESLVALERDGRYSNLEVNSVLAGSSGAALDPADRALYTKLVYGVTERRLTLDYIIGHYSKVKLSELDPDVLTALRLGIYQLSFMSKIPEHAAVGESVDLLPRRLRGYVNAILRQYIRDGKRYELPEPDDDYLYYLSVKYSIPQGICRIINDCYPERTESILDAMNREPAISLHVNTVKTDVKTALEMTGGEPSEMCSDMIRVARIDDSVKAGLESGLWFVQDEASRIAAGAVLPIPGETIVDVCAAPGGKSFSMAIDMNNRGTVYSFDLHKNKLSLIESGAARLGIEIIRTEARDARTPDSALIGHADRVLCDAPCSGLGVLAKKPDIRYRDLSQIGSLPEIQYNILCGASAYLKIGGRLVYSTCTLNKAENEAVVERFIRDNDSYELIETRTFLPDTDGCDGFFYAAMTKVK